MFFTRIAPQEVVPEPVVLIRACDLSATIPDSFTPEFLAAVLERVAKRKVYLRAHPVSTEGSMAFVTLRIENRRTEMARLQGIILAASTLIEPHEHDLIDLEIAASDLAFELDIDARSGGCIERDAIRISKGMAL